MNLVSGINRLEDRKLATLMAVGRKNVKRADADMVKAVTGSSIGGVPPFGHCETIQVFIDQDLIDFDVAWVAAGTPNAVFAVTPRDLIQACGGAVVDPRQE